MVMSSSENERKLVKVLFNQNTWWFTQNVPKTLSKPFRRRDFYFLQDKIIEKEILAIIGPRQVGKTTLLYQLIEHLIKYKKIDPKRVLYLSFDYPYLTTITDTPINDILEIYSTQILREPLQNLKDRVYIFFDEVCKLGTWSSALKGWYDLKYKMKFIVSDSSSSDVLKGSSESLVGRINPYIMLSMKFIDVINYYENNKKIASLLNKINWDLRDGFVDSIKRSDPNIFYEQIKIAYITLAPYEDNFKIHLQKYFLKDGYPELLDIEDLRTCTEKFGNYLSLTLYKDIMKIFNIRDPKTLDELITLLADSTTQRINIDSLSKTLLIKRDTLIKYLNYLESAFMISRLEFYAKSRASRIRKQKKIYLNNTGLRNALIGNLNEDLLSNNVELGKIAEMLVFDHSKRLKFCIEPGFEPKLYYWRTTRGDEVDIIMELFKKPIPIESKYSKNIRKSDLKGIYKFLNSQKKTFGIVITKDKLDLEENIIYIPLWMFLIMC